MNFLGWKLKNRYQEQKLVQILKMAQSGFKRFQEVSKGCIVLQVLETKNPPYFYEGFQMGAGPGFEPGTFRLWGLLICFDSQMLMELWGRVLFVNLFTFHNVSFGSVRFPCEGVPWEAWYWPVAWKLKLQSLKVRSCIAAWCTHLVTDPVYSSLTVGNLAKV